MIAKIKMPDNTVTEVNVETVKMYNADTIRIGATNGMIYVTSIKNVVVIGVKKEFDPYGGFKPST